MEKPKPILTPNKWRQFMIPPDKDAKDGRWWPGYDQVRYFGARMPEAFEWFAKHFPGRNHDQAIAALMEVTTDNPVVVYLFYQRLRQLVGDKPWDVIPWKQILIEHRICHRKSGRIEIEEHTFMGIYCEEYQFWHVGTPPPDPPPGPLVLPPHLSRRREPGAPVWIGPPGAERVILDDQWFEGRYDVPAWTGPSPPPSPPPPPEPPKTEPPKPPKPESEKSSKPEPPSSHKREPSEGPPPDEPVEAEDIFTAPFKSLKKSAIVARTLGYNRNNVAIFEQQINSFPIKENRKRYCLKAVYPAGTWFMDIIIFHAYYYLLLVEATSRMAFARLLNSRSAGEVIDPQTGTINTHAFIKCFSEILNKFSQVKDNIKILQTDNEKCFMSLEAQKFYKDTFGRAGVWRAVDMRKPTEYPNFMTIEHNASKKNPNHSSLAIIDRVVRTIRDMAFNIRAGNITPQVITKLLNSYNNAPHRTLSKIMGFNISPIDVFLDKDLAQEIRRKMTARNQNIYSSKGFLLPTGTRVLIYNEKPPVMKRRAVVKPNVYIVMSYNGAYYKLQREDMAPVICYEPRWRLKPIPPPKIIIE
jgi:hypothetical protein